MAGKTTLFLRKFNRKEIIAMVMIICFIVSYLPVTQSWYLSLNGRSDLSRLVISAMAVKKHLEQKTSEKAVAQSIDLIFKELKIATGITKIKLAPGKPKVLLTEIVPEFPLVPESFRFRMFQDYLDTIWSRMTLYHSISLSIDPRPPRQTATT